MDGVRSQQISLLEIVDRLCALSDRDSLGPYHSILAC